MDLVWASIYCKWKMEKKDFEAGLFDDRISVLELAKSRSKKQSKNETKKLQLDSTLD